MWTPAIRGGGCQCCSRVNISCLGYVSPRGVDLHLSSRPDRATLSPDQVDSIVQADLGALGPGTGLAQLPSSLLRGQDPTARLSEAVLAFKFTHVQDGGQA